MKLDLSRRYRVLLREAKTLHVCLVGVGGTGSALALALCRLAYHCRQKGVEVDLMFVDPDVVEEKNIGRQFFSPPEVGLAKCETMAVRMGAALGLPIRAVPEAFDPAFLRSAWRNANGYQLAQTGHDYLLIGAVDNYRARQALAKAVEEWRGALWWLDCGNGRDNGQILLGNLATAEVERIRLDPLGLCSGLPAPHLQAPGLLEPDPPDTRPLSCAEMVALEEQSLVVNQMVAAVAAQYCHAFLVQRQFTAFATEFTLEPPTTQTRLITEATVGQLQTLAQ